MSTDYLRESGTFCPVEPLLLAFNDRESADRLEAFLKESKQLKTLKARLTKAEKVVTKVIEEFSLTDRLKDIEMKLNDAPETVLTRLGRLEQRFILTWGYMSDGDRQDFLKNIEPATEAMVEAILSVKGVNMSFPGVRCFVNESRGYPYIEESFEFGRLYLDVGYADSQVIEVLTEYTEVEEHEWLVVVA